MWVICKGIWIPPDTWHSATDLFYLNCITWTSLLCFVTNLTCHQGGLWILGQDLDWAVRSPCCPASSDLYLGLSVSAPVPLSLSGCFDKLSNTPGWGRSFALVLVDLSLTPCSWILDLLVGHRHFQDSSYLEHSCAETLWYFSCCVCVFFFLDTKCSFVPILWVLAAPLVVCWLSYPISPTYLTIPSISNNLNSFSSHLSCFQFLPIPQSSTITFSEKPSLTSLMRSYALLTCISWDVDIPSTALPWCMAWHIGWMSISNTTH